MAEIELDKVLIKHLDEMEALEDDLKADIDRLYGKLSIDDLMKDPEGVLTAFVAHLGRVLEEDYYPRAASDGIEFAKKVMADGNIQVPKSKDPNLNEELTDDKSQG